MNEKEIADFSSERHASNNGCTSKRNKGEST